METKTHHGKAAFEIAKEKGFNKAELANALKITRQGLEYHLKKTYWNKETLNDFAIILEVSASEITSRTLKENEVQTNTLLLENSQLRKELTGLWKLIALSGIKVEKSMLNFNWGASSLTAYA